VKVLSRSDAALGAARRLAAARSPADVLEIVAESTHELLGMTTAVNLLLAADDEFVVTHVVGGGEEARALLGARYAQSTFMDMYLPQYLRPDGLYFLPADAPVWGAFDGPIVIEQDAVLDTADAWKPGDMLEIVLRDRAGDVLAVIVADDPADGRFPPPETMAAVALIAQHAASALEAQLASVEATLGQREAEELQHLSAALAAGLDEREVLSRAAEGLCLACGFEFALIALDDGDAHALRVVAGAGHGRRAVGARVPAAAFAAAMQPAYRVSDSYLAPLAAAAGIDALELHHSERNGTGLRGWRRHTLIIPLAAGVGDALGVLWVDDPVDRLLPSPDKVRRMELFARNAALLVSSARLLAAAREQARRDALTGLENARAFEQTLAAEADGALALALIDIDRFKQTNDREGHLKGNAVLRAFATALGSGIDQGVRPYRLGGDEFAVIALGWEAEQLVEWLDGLRREDTVAPFSAGVAVAPLDGAPGPALHHAADTALYAAKRAGRARTLRFHPRVGVGQVPSITAALARVAHGIESPGDVLAALIDGLAGSLGTSWAAYWDHDARGGATCRHVRGEGRTTRVGDVLELSPLDRRRQVVDSLEPSIVHADDAEPDGADVAYVRAAGLASLALIPVLVDGAAIGHLELGFDEPGALALVDLGHAVAVAAIAGLALAREANAAAMESAYRDTVGALAMALEAKDADTGDHARALAELAGAVARRLGLAPDAVRDVEYAALFHDIGKIATPTEILHKPGPLTPAEREVIEQHTLHGARIVEQIGFLRRIAPAVRHSHERWAGGGYPAGLVGEEIPLAARIVFACDTWHAMTSDRPYRGALPVEEAKAELRRVAGTQLDPRIVDALLAALAAGVEAAA
jgi:diguanylate cyclase (GGDEF)-like protein/putative nucleotidyltransferase with HDIG domain